MQRRTFLRESGRAVLGFCLLPPVLRAQTKQPAANAAPSMIAELEKLIPKRMAAGNVPGVAIALVQDAQPVWTRGFGVKDAATRTPAGPDTVFEAASVSKSVFAYAVLKLCQRGVLDLDAPLTRYTKVRLLEGDPRLDLITVRHVLSHTSGLQNWRSDENPLKIHFTPGEKFFYSGEGYSYLQSIVTGLSGRSIEDFMQANLFRPLGMTASGYVWNDTFEKRAARRHDGEGRPLDISRTTADHAARYAAAGALHTTVTDYAKFLREILEPKADEFRLSATEVSEMLRPHTKVDDGSSWALGWKIQHTPRGDLFQHHGGHKGAQVFASASRDRKRGYVVMTNSDNGWKVFFDEAFTEAANHFLLS